VRSSTRGVLDLDALPTACAHMLAALNGLWRRPTLGWRTAQQAWGERVTVDIDRRALREEVRQEAERPERKLAPRGDAADLPQRLAIEHALTRRGLLRREARGWCQVFRARSIAHQHWPVTLIVVLTSSFASGCGGSSHPPSGEADAGGDADADADVDRGEPPVEGPAGADQPGEWRVDPASEREILEGTLVDPTCCDCPGSPISMSDSGGAAVVLASSDGLSDFEVNLFSPLGERIAGPVTVPGYPANSDSADQMLLRVGDSYGALFVDDRDGEREAYLRAIGHDLQLGTEWRLTSRDTPVGLVVGAPGVDGIGVGFTEGSNLFALRADLETGAVADSLQRLTSLGSARGARAAAGDGRLGVAFSDEREGQPDVFFALLDDAGTPTSSEGNKVAATEGPSQNPFVVWTGSEFGVVWEERREEDETASVWFARVDENGVPIDGSDRVVLPFQGEQGPGVGADGYHFPRALLWTGREQLLVVSRGEGRGAGVHRHDIAVFRLDGDGGADPDGPVVLASAVWNDHNATGTLMRRPVAALVGPTELAVAWSQLDSVALANCEGDRAAIHFARLVLDQ